MFIVLIAIAHAIRMSDEDIYKVQPISGWGKIVSSLTQLSGDQSLKELQDAIQEVIKGIDANIHRVDFIYQRKTTAYSAQISKLELSIDEAVTFHARNTDYINSVLLGYTETIEKRLINLEANMNQNKKQVEYLSEVRKRENTAFLSRLDEAQHGLQQIDLCIALMERIDATGEMLQIDRIKASTQKVFAIGLEMQDLINLIQSPEFPKRSDVRQTLKLFADLRDKCLKHLNANIANEADQQTQFEQDLSQLNLEKLNFKKDIAENLYQLSLTQEKLVNTKQAIEAKIKDQKGYETELDLIKNGQALEDKLFASVKAEYASQYEACQKALSLMAQPEFAVRMTSNPIY